MTASPDDIIMALRTYSHGRHVPSGHARGSRNGRSVLMEEQVWRIKRLIEQGVRPKVIMKQFPALTYRNYWYIASGKYWRHVR